MAPTPPGQASRPALPLQAADADVYGEEFDKQYPAMSSLLLTSSSSSSSRLDRRDYVTAFNSSDTCRDHEIKSFSQGKDDKVPWLVLLPKALKTKVSQLCE